MTYKIAVFENEEALRPFPARFFRKSDVAVQIFCFSREEFIRNDPGGFYLAMVGISQRRGMEAAALVCSSNRHGAIFVSYYLSKLLNCAII